MLVSDYVWSICVQIVMDVVSTLCKVSPLHDCHGQNLASEQSFNLKEPEPDNADDADESDGEETGQPQD